MIQKAFAYIVRYRSDTPELLVFTEEDQRSVQVPKGTVNQGEPPDHAVLREVLEESGLRDIDVIEKLGVAEYMVQSGVAMDGPLEQQEHHFFLLKPRHELPDSWAHIVTGKGIDSGMQFHYRWMNIESVLKAQIADGYNQLCDGLLNRFIKK
ncbi:MAG TPA: NUDIX domain-containing protein [Candidatus Kapabacteria bacterium]|nr:NUDIX domain-containing protein [Candidatus Kapabacteria bacterium]